MFYFSSQQDEVLAEQKEYARMEKKPDDHQKVEMVIAYLGALNQFFEQGLVGNKVRVFDAAGSTMQRMERGFKFFCGWIDELIAQGKYCMKLCSQRKVILISLICFQVYL